MTNKNKPSNHEQNAAVPNHKVLLPMRKLLPMNKMFPLTPLPPLREWLNGAGGGAGSRPGPHRLKKMTEIEIIEIEKTDSKAHSGPPPPMKIKMPT